MAIILLFYQQMLTKEQYQNMSAAEPGGAEDVFFTVRDLYTGKRTLRQVKHEEISKVAFVLGQLATQVNILAEDIFNYMYRIRH